MNGPVVPLRRSVRWRASATVTALLLLSGGAWAVLSRPPLLGKMDMAMGTTPALPKGPLHLLVAVRPGMGVADPGLFLALWLLMMVAMMFPSVAPVVVGFARISRARAVWGSVASFVVGYLVSWTAVGTGALLVQEGLVTLLPESRALHLIAGMAIAAGGIYQFTVWKRVCLSYCRTPLSFFLREWRPGVGGAFTMGARHGGFCVGCCWGVMLVLFTVGLMNLAWMAALSAVIALEKVTPAGDTASRVVGGAFVVMGGLTALLS